MSFTINYLTDSEDELLEKYACNTRHARIFKERIDFFNCLDDLEFIMRFRLSKSSVLRILHKINHALESPTNRNNSISPMCKLLITLRFYATGSFLIVIADFSGVHKCTVGRIVHQVTEEICKLYKEFIKMPTSANELKLIQEQFYGISTFPRVFGTIDCTHVRIQSPGGDNAENYRNRKGYFSINVQSVSGPDLKFLNIVARWPGSAHDSTIFNNSALKVNCENGIYVNGVLLGDSGYACKSYLLTPIPHPNTSAEEYYNEAQIRTRNTVERQYGVWKRRFPILAYGIRVKLSKVQGIITACAILHNIAIDDKDALPPTEVGHGNIEEAILEGEMRVITDTENVGPRAVFLNFFENLLQNE